MKFSDEPEEFDMSKTAKVTVTMKATGKTRTAAFPSLVEVARFNAPAPIFQRCHMLDGGAGELV